MPADRDLNAHPLVATPSILSRGGHLPSAVGVRQPTGAFDKTSLDTMVAIAEAMFSTNAGPCPPERLLFVSREIADMLSRAAFRGRLMFRLGALVVSIVAPLLVRRMPPFSRLPLPLRIEALRRFEARPIGAVLIALRALLCIVYYEHPDAAAEVGVVVGPNGRLK